jgi:gamma-glutamylcyclotransferase
MQRSVIHYLAYGSNLHPLRLKERIPSAKIVGTTQLSSHKIVFHKQSDDGSGKCNLLQTGMNADITNAAIYQLKPEDKATLDRVEGKGNGYEDKHMSIRLKGLTYNCFVYLAQPSHIVSELLPYHWYKELVILGAEFLSFPDSYVSAIRNFVSIEDEDLKRKQENDKLIKRIHRYQQ